MYLRSYRLQETWLDKCLKSPVSEDPSKCNIANGLKHRCNLNERTFATFINHCEGIFVGESLFK